MAVRKKKMIKSKQKVFTQYYFSYEDKGIVLENLNSDYSFVPFSMVPNLYDNKILRIRIKNVK